MCLDELRKIRENYKKHLTGHYFQCRSEKLFSEGRGKAVITRYNELQCVTSKKLQKIGMCTTFNEAQEIFFLKKGEKLLQ